MSEPILIIKRSDLVKKLDEKYQGRQFKTEFLETFDALASSFDHSVLISTEEYEKLLEYKESGKVR